MFVVSNINKIILKNVLRSNIGQLSKCWTRSLKRKSLVISEFGKPLKVLELVEDELAAEKLGNEEVLLKVLMSAINPSDLSIIQGKFKRDDKKISLL